MLREGVSRYSLTAGQVRNKLLADEPWLVQGTYQRGIGNQLTLYGGSALSEGYLSLLYGVGLSTRRCLRCRRHPCTDLVRPLRQPYRRQCAAELQQHDRRDRDQPDPGRLPLLH